MKFHHFCFPLKKKTSAKFHYASPPWKTSFRRPPSGARFTLFDSALIHADITKYSLKPQLLNLWCF